MHRQAAAFCMVARIASLQANTFTTANHNMVLDWSRATQAEQGAIEQWLAFERQSTSPSPKGFDDCVIQIGCSNLQSFLWRGIGIFSSRAITMASLLN